MYEVNSITFPVVFIIFLIQAELQHLFVVAVSLSCLHPSYGCDRAWRHCVFWLSVHLCVHTYTSVSVSAHMEAFSSRLAVTF